MKILLINPSWGGKMRSQRYNRRWPPLDMLNLAALLQNNGHFVFLHDARADGLSLNRLSRLTAEADRVVVNTSPLDRWQCPNLDLTHYRPVGRVHTARKAHLVWSSRDPLSIEDGGADRRSRDNVRRT